MHVAIKQISLFYCKLIIHVKFHPQQGHIWVDHILQEHRINGSFHQLIQDLMMDEDRHTIPFRLEHPRFLMV